MIKIICLGKIKENYFNFAIEEYKKRLSKYTKLEIIELNDEKDDDIKSCLQKEKDNILNHIKEKDNLVILFKKLLFLKSKKLTNKKISFSKLTFPHQLFRIILLEQIYRGFKIINNESYHK